MVCMTAMTIIGDIWGRDSISFKTRLQDLLGSCNSSNGIQQMQ